MWQFTLTLWFNDIFLCIICFLGTSDQSREGIIYSNGSTRGKQSNFSLKYINCINIYICTYIIFQRSLNWAAYVVAFM